MIIKDLLCPCSEFFVDRLSAAASESTVAIGRSCDRPCRKRGDKNNKNSETCRLEIKTAAIRISSRIADGMSISAAASRIDLKPATIE